MRSVVYSENGPSSVLRLVERDADQPGPGEVRVRIVRSAVNPADWKVRAGFLFPPAGEVVPNLDGAGVIDAAGDSELAHRVGERVWLSSKFSLPSAGTAQERVVLPSSRVWRLPSGASFDLGASLGVPAFTAHRALSSIARSERLQAGTLAGATILVAGGAGAVGHAAIQLARFAGATVVATVSGPEKVLLARSAGADAVLNYHDEQLVDLLKGVAGGGVDGIVEVAIGANAELDRAILRSGGSIAIYSNDRGGEAPPDLLSFMQSNARFQLIALPALPDAYFAQAAEDIAAAVDHLKVGADHGLPLHHFPLEEIASAHDAVAGGAVGRVLIDVGEL